MATRAKLGDRERRRDPRVPQVTELAGHSGAHAKRLVPVRGEVHAEEADSQRVRRLPVSIRLQGGAMGNTPAWIDVRLPSGALVRVLPGVDAATFACVLALGAELSVKEVVESHPAAAASAPSGRGRR